MLWLVSILLISPHVTSCPIRCTCHNVAEGTKLNFNCRRSNSSSFLKPHLLKAAYSLDLSYNGDAYKKLSRKFFFELSNVRILILQSNKVSSIEPLTFTDMTSLEQLDLSNNALSKLDPRSFQGLLNLKILNVSGNPLMTVSNKLKVYLSHLSLIDLSFTQLTCNCKLKWMRQNELIKTTNSTVCVYPFSLRNVPLSHLGARNFTCEDPLDLDEFRLSPFMKQVVFEGDEIPFSCTATYNPHMKIMWLKDGEEFSRDTKFSRGEIQVSRDGTSISNRLTITDLQVDDGGVYTCKVLLNSQEREANVEIMVLRQRSFSCPAETINSSRGLLEWRRTVSTITQKLPCPNGHTEGHLREPWAMRTCLADGTWGPIILHHCRFVDPISLQLFNISRMSISSIADAIHSAHKLANVTRLSKKFVNFEDVSLAVASVKRLSSFANKSDKLVTALLNITSDLMSAAPELLYKAEIFDSSCHQLTSLLTNHLMTLATKSQPVFTFISKNFAIKSVQLRHNAQFQGLYCGIFQSSPGAFNQNDLVCYSGSDTSQKPHMAPLAAVEIHKSLGRALLLKEPHIFYKVQFVFFFNSYVFPIMNAAVRGDWRISSSIVTTQIVKSNMSSPDDDEIMRDIRDVFELTLAHRNKAKGLRMFRWISNNNLGGKWMEANDCRAITRHRNVSKYTCTLFSNLALMERTDALSLGLWSDRFNFMTKTASAICSALSLLVFLTYCCLDREMFVARKSIHILCNLSLCSSIWSVVFGWLLPLSVPFDVGCFILVLVFLFFTYALAVWFTIYCRNLCKQFLQIERTLEHFNGSETSVIKFYIIGWVFPLCAALVVAGFNLIVPFDSPTICQLDATLFSICLFVPIGSLDLASLCFLLRTACFSSSLPPKLEVLQKINTKKDTFSDKSTVEATIIIHARSRCRSQLQSAFLLFILLNGQWTLGFLNIRWDMDSHHVLSSLFAVSSVCFGIFLFFNYCLWRRDVKKAYINCMFCRKQHSAFSTQYTYCTGLPQGNYRNYNHQANFEFRNNILTPTHTFTTSLTDSSNVTDIRHSQTNQVNGFLDRSSSRSIYPSKRADGGMSSRSGSSIRGDLAESGNYVSFHSQSSLSDAWNDARFSRHQMALHDRFQRANPSVASVNSLKQMASSKENTECYSDTSNRSSTGSKLRCNSRSTVTSDKHETSV